MPHFPRKWFRHRWIFSPDFWAFRIRIKPLNLFKHIKYLKGELLLVAFCTDISGKLCLQDIFSLVESEFLMPHFRVIRNILHAFKLWLSGYKYFLGRMRKNRKTKACNLNCTNSIQAVLCRQFGDFWRVLWNRWMRLFCFFEIPNLLYRILAGYVR